MHRVALIIVHYKQPELLRDCLQSLSDSGCAGPGVKIQTVVLDNASDVWPVDELRDRFPDVHFLRKPVNLGFAGGNNAAWQWIEQHLEPPDFLMLLNPDTRVTPGWLSPLLERLASDPTLAAVQPLITLLDAPDRINTRGNDCHYLGFGLMRGYREAAASVPDEPQEIPSVSGAAVLIRARVVRELGLFDASYFLYLEDTELSWRWRLAGYRMDLVPQSRIAHRHSLQAPRKQYRYLERNRYCLILVCYRWPTLVLLLPALLLMEAGQWLFALSNGLVTERLWVIGQLLNPANRRTRRAVRRRIQKQRRVSDRQLTELWCARFPASLLPGRLVQAIANPLLAIYWRLARFLLWW